jgi:hypothetical protein
VPFTQSEQASNESTTKPPQNQTPQEVTNLSLEHNSTDSQQNHNNSLQQKCATGVHQNIAPEILPDDLAIVVERWPNLPENIRAAIRNLVQPNNQGDTK